MTQRLKHLIIGFMSLITLTAAPVAVPAIASAQTSIQNCIAQGTNLNATGLGSSCNGNTNTSGSTQKINNLIHTIINIFSLIVGIVSVIMIIVGGLRYITSGGDSNNVSAAKNTIIYAIIGLVVVALAQFIVQFVLNKVTQP